MAERVLVVAAHPDDEVLGCGGTSARHAAAGDDVHVLIVAEGATSRDPARQAKERSAETSALRDAAVAAAEVLGTRPPRFAGLPDNRLDGQELLDVVKVVEEVVIEVRPSIVYCHHGGDLNVDHRIVHQAVVTACRPLPGSPVKTLLTFETLSSSEWATSAIGAPFRPTRFVDVGPQLEAKLRALQCYGTEMRPFPHPRSPEAVEALARLRGSTVGIVAAEAFEVLRDIVAHA